GWAILFSFLCLLLFVSGALGQTSRGGIAGTVADKSGAVVPDAAVEIEQKGTGLKLSTSTTGAGVFSFPDLPVGFYNVTITHSGVQTPKITDLEVQVGRISSVTVSLEVAEQPQAVDCQTAASTIVPSQLVSNAS